MNPNMKNLFAILFNKVSCFKKKDMELSCFISQKGSKYQNGLLVIGRAANGGAVKFTPDYLLNFNYKKALLKELINNFEPSGYCSMKWVADRWGQNEKSDNLKRSAFWSVIKEVTVKLNIVSERQLDWPSFISYSNLYKISPANGGNPSESLCNIQFEPASEILLNELDELQPSKILFLTSWNWAEPFFKKLYVVSENKNSKNKFVEWSGLIKLESQKAPVAVVVAKHPQGKPQQKIVDEILSAFDKISD